MDGTEFDASVARLRDIERQVQNAQVEVKVREERLAELRPRREALEKRSLEEFECAVRDLPARIMEAEEKFITEVARLETDVKRVAVG